MDILKQAFWNTFGFKKDHYRTYVETGTYRGHTIEDVINKYDVIHSIELSKKWFSYCATKFSKYGHVNLWLGDSRKALPIVLETIDEPAVIFLDAHYSGGTTARGNNDTPLLDELEIVNQRAYPDIIIIDDTSFLGLKAGSEPAEPVSDDAVWPTFAYDWRDTTREQVLARMKPGYALVTNENLNLASSTRDDQYILYPADRINVVS